MGSCEGTGTAPGGIMVAYIDHGSPPRARTPKARPGAATSEGPSKLHNYGRRAHPRSSIGHVTRHAVTIDACASINGAAGARNSTVPHIRRCSPWDWAVLQ